jgi:trehalose synthase
MKLGPIQVVPLNARSPAPFATVLGPESVQDLETTAAALRRRLGGRVIWNVNSTAAGGGVAELLHSLLAYARGFEVDARWVVISGTTEFFKITKRLHNALHGEAGDGSELGDRERRIYEEVTLHNAAELCGMINPRDIVILHDPQTAGMIPHLTRRKALVIWRCHIGNDQPSVEGDRGWSFLEPALRTAHALVFSRFAYVPDFCDHGRSLIVAPSIDPFSAKNQELDGATVRAVVTHTGLVGGSPAEGRREFVRDDGSVGRVERRAEMLSVDGPPDPNMPLVVQVSRWDRLKDPEGVLRGFSLLRNAEVELLLAGPDCRAVADDPEGAEVFDELCRCWSRLAEPVRRRVHLATLPMDDLQENAAIVNALQRHASVVVQKSLREGFGLTVTEAMWKGRAVVASAVGGIQDQIEHGVSGLLLRNPSDVDAFATILDQLLARPALAAKLGKNARNRVRQQYLGLRSLAQYADLIERLDD